MGLQMRRGAEAAGRAAQPSTLALYQRLETLLTSGGDTRLSLSAPAMRNAYGCTPFPRDGLLDFASSTASNISEHGYARAQSARKQFLARASLTGIENAFEASCERARAELKTLLGLDDSEVVFSPSGTDAQLQALFVAKAVLGGRLVSIIAGADQSGSGTRHTARGEHFSAITARQVTVKRGAAVRGLAGQLRTIAVDFCDTQGRVRSAAQMDDAVRQAVSGAVNRGEKVLLQAMDASKLGWRAPGAACLDAIAASWPDDVLVVVDACQMRLSPARLRHYLAQNYLVLMTGSKFISGPAFSGALLVPPQRAAALDGISRTGLEDYSTRFDWPQRWASLRAGLSSVPNYGQWLRWEAALEEMDRFAAVPASFRDGVLELFAAGLPERIARFDNFTLLAAPDGVAARDDTVRHATIFSFVPHQDGQPLSHAQCGKLYRAMANEPGPVCLIGQPVALGPVSVLRLCASARLVTRCWSRGAASPAEAVAPELADVEMALGKLDQLIARLDLLS